MSRHIPRKERWEQVNAKEYRSAFGVVRYHAGAWEGTLHYELRHEEKQGEWLSENAFAGRYKRPRNAMMAVEDKAVEISRRHQNNVKVGFPFKEPASDLPRVDT